MGGRISVIGTEAYYDNVDNPDNHMREVAFDYLSDWWSDEIEDSSDDYDTIFSRLHSEIPENELRISSMSDRRQDANEWLENNISSFESRGSIQIVDWVEKSGDGWPLGLAGVGTAMTDLRTRRESRTSTGSKTRRTSSKRSRNSGLCSTNFSTTMTCCTSTAQRTVMVKRHSSLPPVRTKMTTVASGTGTVTSEQTGPVSVHVITPETTSTIISKGGPTIVETTLAAVYGRFESVEC